MAIQLHNKTHENVFSSDRQRSPTKLRLEEITAGDMTLEEYTKQFQKFLNSFYSDFFLNCVKLSWMRRRFTYRGKKIILPMQKNSPRLNLLFVKFMRRYVGKDLQIITRDNVFSKLENCFDQLFPGFEEGNPFENPDYYRFPFKNITLEFLIVVYQVEDWIELLKVADEQKMTFAIFLDFVINHVLSENERLDRTRYVMRHNTDRAYPFFVRDMDRQLKVKRKRHG